MNIDSSFNISFSAEISFSHNERHWTMNLNGPHNV